MKRTLIKLDSGIYQTWHYHDCGLNVIHITNFKNRGNEFELWIKNNPSGIVYKSLKKAEEAMEAWTILNGGG